MQDITRDTSAPRLHSVKDGQALSSRMEASLRTTTPRKMDDGKKEYGTGTLTGPTNSLHAGLGT